MGTSITIRVWLGMANILNGASWQPDGGDMTSFNGKSGNGTWTLFLADLSGGSVSSVTSWGMDINVVTEPVTLALGGFGVIAGLTGLARWWSRPRLTKAGSR